MVKNDLNFLTMMQLIAHADSVNTQLQKGWNQS
jgi:hypothetical protein